MNGDAFPFEVTASAPAEGGWVLAVRVPAETPLCDGHFPGRPIVPGVAELALVERALAAWRGGVEPGGEGLSGIPSLRLRQTVVPGEELEVRVREGAAGSVVFEVRRGEVVVTNGSVTRGTPLLASGQIPSPGGEGRGSGAVMPSRAGLPPVEQLVPHRGPMLFLQEIAAAEPGWILARAAVPLSNALAPSGLAPAWLGLEAAAQASAAHEALARMAASPDAASAARIGYLVAVRDALLGAPFPAGAALLATVRESGAAGGLASYEVEVSLEADGRPVARGRLSTYAAE